MDSLSALLAIAPNQVMIYFPAGSAGAVLGIKIVLLVSDQATPGTFTPFPLMMRL
jgi:hypothetical protein